MSKVQPDSSRIAWLDMARGYGILLVIFTHICPGQILSEWMFSFHMPLFFFLSGFVFRAKGNFGSFLKKKAKGLLIPYFSLAVPMILAELLLNPESGGFTVSAVLGLCGKVILQQQHWTLWYLTSLFLVSILFCGMVVRISSEWLLAGVSVAMAALGLLYDFLGGPVLVWNLELTFTVMPFYCAGYLCARHYAQIKTALAEKKAVAAFLMLGAVNLGAFLAGERFFGTGLDLFQREYGFPLLTYPAAFAGIGCVVLLSHGFRIRPIEYIGRNSMLYFAWHQTIFMPLAALLFQTAGIPREFSRYLYVMGERLVEMVVIVILITLCHALISRSKLKFMLGK